MAKKMQKFANKRRKSMDTRKKQNILTVVIVIALIGVAVILTSMFYDEKMKAEKTSSTISNEVTSPKEE